MKSLEDQLAVLPGFGTKSAEKFLKVGIKTIKDALLYYPYRYEDFKTKSVLELSDGEKALILGEVVTPASVQYYGYKRNRLRFSIRQGEVIIGVSFFNQPYLVDKVELGAQIAIWGKWDKAKTTLTGMKILSQSFDELQPVYHLVQGLKQSSFVKLIQTIVENGYIDLLQENVPVLLLERYHLMGRQQAVRAMHFPATLEEYRQALRRIKFEELFYFQLNLQQLKSQGKQAGSGLVVDFHREKLDKKIAELPFELTTAQRKSLDEILGDMSSSSHMNRLLQGDVGSGKTVVAGLAMYAAFTAGFQSALLVPTEILAEQHYISLSQLFPELSIALLTGSMKVAARRTALAAIESGQVDMIVGTHALIQEGVSYHNLGLVITDEQHRFGVQQRRMFREKGENPDVLMMTATPIPRTLAITAFGEMDVSIIDQLPAGRKEIKTRWVKHEQLPVVLDWIGKEIHKGAQVYVVSPLIEESEALDLKNAIALEEELVAYFGNQVRIALLHGQMKSQEKDEIMQQFKAGAIDLLVSTTVIEVGVNVPNATIMVIMDADRFGLSQLHQLRGRVGRGDKQSYAILVANPKTESGQERMQIMTETTDGFVLAEKDLQMRGSGEIFGTRQSGLPEFQVANIIDDFPILEEARKVAAQITADPEWIEKPEWSVLMQELERPKQLD
ncbi:ATP-dependent DNA helicase RecG [Streptococcus ovis]|uniref:ATP-dependent DNA helicase RecG n=1 Tax=Streptococcus ovis TaxID=82806 RepID=UPI000377A1D4|nr:ATP-dependent DNA helicase RecG [Streptococcus ovis]